MIFLILNWRDIDNPAAGGAEVLTHEIARRWVEWGHEVILFAPKFPGCSGSDEIDGVQIVRRGNQLTVYLHAWKYYRKNLRGKVDVVIEEYNGGRPWYTHYYVKEPKLALIHQNGRNFNEYKPKNSVAYYELPPVVRWIAYSVEAFIVRYFRRLPLLVVSESTKKDFLDLKHRAENIHLIPEGINIEPVEEIPTKEKKPTFIYLGRLRKSKRVGHVIKALHQVRSECPEIQLWIIGRGPPSYRKKLTKLVKELNLEKNTTFFDFLSEEKKNELLGKAHALVITSIREGWGLVVTEANAMGTPAIGYDVAGLRDSIDHGRTGILVKSGDIDALANAMRGFIGEPGYREKLTGNAWEWSKEFSWDRSAKVCLKRIEDIIADLGEDHKGK